jgi:aryl-alcohol dehydrogenase-like predicted oxidoreductase
MEYVPLGNSGLQVSRVAIGSWLTYGSSVDVQGAGACVRRALESGVILVDSADVYARGEGERVLGEVLAPVRRSDYVLATKVFWPMSENPNDRGLSRKHVFESIHGSLKRLRTDYVDLYQCHRYDPGTPVPETVRAMGDLVAQGKILYWGVSCWTAAQILDACRTADALGVPRPISNQPQYNLLERGIEAEVVPRSRAEGLSQIVWSPLAQGVLSGKYAGGKRPAGSRGADARRSGFMKEFLVDETLSRVDRFAALAREAGTSPAKLALRWCLRDGNVASAIVGATRPEQVDENLACLDVALDPELLARIDAIFPPPAPPEEP